MSSFLSFYEKMEFFFSLVLKYLLVFCLGGLVLVVLWQVVARYVVRSSTGWTEELSEFALMWISILGTTVLFREKSHLGVDFFVKRFKESVQKKIEWVVYLVLFFFIGYVMIQGSAVLLLQAFTSHHVTPVLHINRGYIYSVFLLCSAVIFIFNLGHFLRLSYDLMYANNKANK